MISPWTFAVLLFMAILMGAIALKTEHGDTKFIATVHEGHDPHAVAKDIAHRGKSEEHKWAGSVERTHAAIRVIIVNGPKDTCQVLEKIDGIKLCEEDSIVSIYD